eukprot:SAG11_NODE_544_length_8629_cov_3.550229_3_plen_159_part_00
MLRLGASPAVRTAKGLECMAMYVRGRPTARCQRRCRRPIHGTTACAAEHGAHTIDANTIHIDINGLDAKAAKVSGAASGLRQERAARIAKCEMLQAAGWDYAATASWARTHSCAQLQAAYGSGGIAALQNGEQRQVLNGEALVVYGRAVSSRCTLESC